MIIEILLTITILILSVTLFYALRRINQYENFLVEIEQVITFSTEKMKQVDAKGIYEAEDETGFFFEQLKSIQLLLDGIFVNEKETK
tara:strand:- start:524 stop:784 length:261 start_codon:yes stop_codon:yes gene_type:complete